VEVICFGLPQPISEHDKAIPRFVQRENTARLPRIKQTLTDRVANQFLDGIAHRTRA